jgi:predicted outer membrane repeat protein
VWADSATITLRRTTVTGCSAAAGGGLYANASTLTLDAVTFQGCTASVGFGGGLGVDGSTVTGRGLAFLDDLADDPIGDEAQYGLGGGVFAGNGSTLDLVGCDFERDEARSSSGDPDSGRGAAIRLWTSDATIDRCRFLDNGADEYGSAVAAASSTVALTQSWAVGNHVDEPKADPSYGGTLFCDSHSDCAVDRTWFASNRSGDGGAICSPGDLTVTTSMFCANTAGSDGGGIDLGNLASGETALVSGSVFALNSAGMEGGAIVAGDGDVTLRNLHLVGNDAPSGAALADEYGQGDAGFVLASALIADNTSPSGAVVELSDIPYSEGWNWVNGNSVPDADVVPALTDGFGDPGLVGPAASCAPADLLLGSVSPLRDAGDPDAAWNDPDGTRGDIGAFGGPYADASAFLDGDGDGWPAMVDCDDGDAAVAPDALEVCNGLDDDCDDLVDADDAAVDAAWLFVDADGDGVGGEDDAAWACPGAGWSLASTDCDDTDPGVITCGTTPTDPTGGTTPTDPTSTGPGTVALPGDRDGDEVLDDVDPDPDDAGGTLASPVGPDLGCGCAEAGSSGWVALVVAGLAVRTPRPGRARGGAAPRRARPPRTR